MAGARRGFGPEARLRRPRDYARLAREGRRVASQSFVLLAARATTDDARAQQVRLGITASRKVGKAVARNRVKRRVREWFRSRREGVPTGVDLVVIARPQAASLTAAALAGELDRLLERLRKACSRADGGA